MPPFAFLLVCKELDAIHRNVIPVIGKLVLSSWMEDVWNEIRIYLHTNVF
jgi:hypothetical protein